jgi:hypothetical protein
MSGIDRLFMMWGCQSCSSIRAILDDSKLHDDSYFGRNGNRLFCFWAFSDDAGRNLLDAFGLKSFNAPVLLKEGDKPVTDVGKIIDYLKANGYGDVRK